FHKVLDMRQHLCAIRIRACWHWNKIDIARGGFFNSFMKRALIILLTAVSSAFAQDADVIIKSGIVYDGSAGEGQNVDVAIKGDRIVKIADLKSANAKTVTDAKGLAVPPGSINLLS